MGNYELYICYKWGRGSEAEEELRKINYYSSALIPDERCGLDVFEVLWRKGFRHMATILATAYDLKFSKQSGMKDVYEKLKQKVKVWVRSEDPWGPSDYIVPRVFWPCEILDLKEVQDEVEVLVSGRASISLENPEDRRIMEQAVKRVVGENATMEEIDKKINENLGIVNKFMKNIGAFLTRVTEFHRKHPKMRFWFYVEFG